MKENLTFNVMIESDKSRMELLGIFLSSLPGSTIEGAYIRYEGNILELGKNISYDEEKARCDEDAWMYYRFDLTVFPEGQAEGESQVELANKILAIVRDCNGRAELVADF